MWSFAITELQRVPAFSGLRQKKVIELIRETAPRIDYLLNPETAVADQTARQFYERNNHSYFTRAETLAILERHGLREVHRFIHESNFVFEAATKL